MMAHLADERSVKVRIDKQDERPIEIKDTDPLVDRYRSLCNSVRFSDITLEVGGTRFFAHRFILITASSVFEAMLEEKRWQESGQPEVHLTEEDECVDFFGDFLRYIYSGEASLTTANVMPLLLLADKYEVYPLRQTCLKFMSCQIVQVPNTNKTLTWYQYAQMTGQTALRDQCLNFILSNFDIIMQAADWTDMPLHEMTGFLASSNIIVQSEADLWSKVEKWLLAENNVHNAEKNLKEVLPLVRFTMMSPKTLLQVEESDVCKKHLDLFGAKLSHAYRHHSLVMDNGDVDNTSSVHQRESFRNYYSEEYCVGHHFTLLDYSNVSKSNSRIALDCSVRQRFVTPSRAKSEDLTNFSVYFYPHGYFTPLTLYGSYVGVQSCDVRLKVTRSRTDLQPMKVDVTLVLFGKQNSLKYAAFTHNRTLIFSKGNHTHNMNMTLDLEDLKKENSPYLVDRNLEGTIFLKIQDVGEHLIPEKH